VVERIATLLPDSPDAYPRWKDLIVTHGVRGVQVHDAKLVALMTLHGVTHILTLNPKDFARYSAISAVTPEELLAAASTP
jgi:predicted nucleic acid-binding protein